MQTETIRLTIADHVAKVEFNRPNKKNAMNPQLHKDMTAVLEFLRYEDTAKVLVITGAGDAFCAGMDLKEFFHDLRAIRRSTTASSGSRPNGARRRCATIPSRRSPW